MTTKIEPITDAARGALLPTFSGLPRWFACELQDVLPAVQESSEASRAGVARHYFFQRISDLQRGIPTEEKDPNGNPVLKKYDLEAARELSLADAPDEHREVLAAIPLHVLEGLGLDETAAEVTLALDLETGEARELGRGLERDYSSAKPTELVGTVDRLGFRGSDGLYVGDYKGRSHRSAPSEDPQFLAAALAASRLYGRSWAQIEVIKVLPSSTGEGVDVFPYAEDVDRVDLDTFELRLAERRAKMIANRARFAKDANDLPEGTIGSHCAYCTRLRFCPPMMAIARAMLGGDSDDVRGIVKCGAAYIDDESAPRLHAAVQHAEKLLEIVKTGLREYARATPVRLPDGRMYGVPPDATRRELLDGEAVQKVLAELYGADAAKAGISVKATLEGVESTVKKYLSANPSLSKKGAIKNLKEAAEAELAKRGLLRTIAGGQVKVYKPKEA